MRRCPVLLSVLFLSPLIAADVPAPTGKAIVDPDARLELLFTRSAPIKGGLTEGPAVAPDGSIFFSDIPFGEDKGMTLRFDPKTKKITVFSNDSGKSNGLIFDAKGRLLACEGAGYGGRRVSRTDVKTGRKSTVADRYRGRRFNSPNDLCLDAAGRIYFSDPRYVGHEPRELKHRAVYCIEPDGNVFEVTHRIDKPNGLAISPDGRFLYVADHDNGTDNIDPDAKKLPRPGDMRIYAFPLGPDGRVAGRRQKIVDFDCNDSKGCDGMTVDARGNLYLTVREPTRPGVMVVDPYRGIEAAFIPTGPMRQADRQNPVGLPSNVEFGIGDELNMLYITVDKSLYRIRLRVEGFHVQYRAGKARG